MTFVSILFDQHIVDFQETTEVPQYFQDLNLDQLIEAIIARRQDYILKPFFYFPVNTLHDVLYRQAVFKDLESTSLFTTLDSFSQQISQSRRLLAMAGKLYNRYHVEGWFLAAVRVYTRAIKQLVSELTPIDLHSEGLCEFRDYCIHYIQSDLFTTLDSEAETLQSLLSSIQYTVTIRGNAVRVQNYEQQDDYSCEIESIFEKFKQNEVKDYTFKMNQERGLNLVEAQILDNVARLFPDTFAHLDTFVKTYQSFFDPVLDRFDREIQFYLAYVTFMKDVQNKGLNFCLPALSDTDKEIQVQSGYDLALASTRLFSQSPVVCNDFFLVNPERILIISGPNQGGKTTFARAFGQLHYLAKLGCPVPAKSARLYFYDQLFTHFEKEEKIVNLRGKLQDDLVRMHNILQHATPGSILILNEIFNSTTINDAVFLSKQILSAVIELDLICVCVTFIDELSTLSEKTVSMVSMVAPDDPAQRTFKIIRKPADGLSYAIYLAEKYRLTYPQLMERINK